MRQLIFERFFTKSQNRIWMSLAGCLISAEIFYLVGTHGSGFMLAATVSYFLMCSGLLMRSRRQIHGALMSSAIAIDLAIVLTLEVQREAIKTAISFTLSPLQQMHIGASVVATLLYFPMIYLGVLKFLGKSSPKKDFLHLRLGIATFFFRSLGFLFMFSLLKSALP